MRYVVLVKQVPDTYDPRRLDDHGRMVRTVGKQVIDEVGERALELALCVREAGRSGEVVAMTMGPASAREAVRHALAMGADRAVHICDERLVGADQIQTALVLAAALRSEEPDLILTGHQSSDGGGGMVPALLAQMLGMPLLSELGSVLVGDNEVTGTRIADLGVVSLRAALPAIVTVTDQLPEGRMPTLRGVLGAKRKPMATPTLTDLGIACTGPTTVVTSVQQRPRRAVGVRVPDDGTGARQLADFLADRGLI